jgi:hypothetical protein
MVGVCVVLGIDVVDARRRDRSPATRPPSQSPQREPAIPNCPRYFCQGAHHEHDHRRFGHQHVERSADRPTESSIAPGKGCAVVKRAAARIGRSTRRRRDTPAAEWIAVNRKQLASKSTELADA